MKKLLLLPIILFAVVFAYAQTGEIKGTVRDKATGEPIWNVYVYVEEAGNLKGAASDFDGKYTIKPLNSGVYTITVQAMGYKTSKIENVTITSNRITLVDVKAEASAIDIEEVEIVWVDYEKERPLISVDEPNVESIGLSEIKTNPNMYNPVKMLGDLPRVTVSETGQVYISGGRPQSTQFITDGIKSITGEIGINGQAIGSMKVYTGGVPAQYGDLTGGVIVVETKSYFDLAQQYK
ncbi:MAG: carboxypeptidase-like regulatory domain-containing protein [Vicingus serpentipes]|nr:carboxypeptidase-like regulatory domain-containing protein [Vicingus serpentipes]